MIATLIKPLGKGPAVWGYVVSFQGEVYLDGEGYRRRTKEKGFTPTPEDWSREIAVGFTRRRLTGGVLRPEERNDRGFTRERDDTKVPWRTARTRQGGFYRRWPRTKGDDRVYYRRGKSVAMTGAKVPLEKSIEIEAPADWGMQRP
jgi:hypothetical protein